MKRVSWLAWWVGVTFIVAVLTWGPYVLMQIVQHVSWSWYRIPAVPIILYDSSAYFEWIGAALAHIDFGQHIRFFSLILRAFAFVLPSSFYIAEHWLFSLCVSVIASVWLSARAIFLWSGVSQKQARWIALLFSLSVIFPYMPRPGVFTWYVPFYALGLMGVWYVYQNLNEFKYIRALFFTFFVFGVSWIYPYYFLHFIIWLAIAWVLFFQAKSPFWTRVVAGIGTVFLVVFIYLITPRLFHLSFQLAYAMQEHLGLTFTRLPVFSNSLILVIAWILFFAYLLVHFRDREMETRLLWPIFVGWIALGFGWLSNIFTHVYVHQDHFRAPAVIFSWVSFSIVWRLKDILHKKHPLWMAYGFVFFSTMGFIVYVFLKRFVLAGDYLNIVHASHWLALAASSWLLVCPLDKPRFNHRTFAVTITLCALALGTVARGKILLQEWKLFPFTRSIVPVVFFLQGIHPQIAVCTDPKNAELLGSFSGHLAYPTFATLVLPQSIPNLAQHLLTELSIYDAKAAHTEEAYIYSFVSMRGTACTQFSLFEKIFVRMGMTPSVFDRFSGCPRSMIQKQERFFQNQISRRQTIDEDSVRTLCPLIVVAKDQRAYWAIPKGYREELVDPVWSVWHAPLTERE